MKRLMIVLTAAILLMLCGCREKPSVLIEPVETEGTNTTVAGDTTAPTAAKPELIDKQLVFTDLMMLNNMHMKWSWFEPYDHELTSDTTARFTVASNNDPDILAVLDITFDVGTDAILQAELSYDGVTANVMTDNDLELYPVMRKMVEAEKR